jgi:hypothetical protein
MRDESHLPQDNVARAAAKEPPRSSSRASHRRNGVPVTQPVAGRFHDMHHNTPRLLNEKIESAILFAVPRGCHAVAQPRREVACPAVALCEGWEESLNRWLTNAKLWNNASK